ncbi:tyrosine-type recombinase/integrase [Cellulomonas fengjieae]|uniref:Site-specific integrase n=1 Tax=Cellulomonas fengjieae TaxID=2819978 RepID=A0ABS3SEF4_9CELL|nr:site-specific integrase [Cellulomonas fengjieae]MBO3084112.1 site-specific integrase [Cellulomonas fengjieae]QVI64633.1 site-specific integrase [Cellulomonas fengjieae]
MTGALIHSVTEQDALRVALRAEALQLFADRYRHSPESQRAMLGGLRRLATTFSEGANDERTFPWELLVNEQLANEVWSSVAAGFAHKTAVRDASALRVLLGFCYRVGLLTYEQYRHARSFEAKGGKHLPRAGTYLSTEDMATIVHTTEHGRGSANTRIRDVALLMTMAGSGPRRDEVTNVLLKDVHVSERRVWLGRTKGGRPRDAYLHPSAVEALTRWLEVRGEAPGALFVPLSRTGRPMLEHGNLSAHQTWKIIQARASDAGFNGISPHDFRRFLISHLLETTDVVLVAAIVGHKSTQTTAEYDQRPAAKQRDAVATIELPTLGRVVPDRPAG